MKKNTLFMLLIGLISCNDGDLEIEAVDFDSIETVEFCDGVSVSSENLLFKINGNEGLILELPSGLIKNEVTTEDIVSEVPAATQITYRIFSDNVSSSYFCDAVPPITPTVLEELDAEDGQVFITTKITDSGSYEHTIQLSGISFVTEDGSRITNLEINEFGTVTTEF